MDEAPRNLMSILSSSSSSASDLNVSVEVILKQMKRFTARTGTDIGNGEGSGYANFLFRSLFGGAEFLSFDASIGTRTRSSYLLNFTTPVFDSYKWKLENLAFVRSRNIPWASHDQMIRGISTKLKSTSGDFEVGYEASLRTITSVKESASDAIRDFAGDSIKTSLFWNYARDTRNNPLMASRGYYFKLGHEISGLLGPEKGDIPYMKGTFEGQVAGGFSFSDLLASPPKSENIEIPVIETDVSKLIKDRREFLNISDDITFQYSVKGGLIWSYLDGKTHFMDRFFLGGPNDVRGFSFNSLGPRDGADYLGGETFLAQGVSILTRLPYCAKTNPLRFMAFVNGGSLLHLDQQDVKGTLLELATKPSIATGFGLAYRHPVARFELNVTFPLIAREQEGVRKGLQFGVGLSFL